MKKFEILPIGPVKGGTFEYDYDQVKQKLTYSLSGKVSAFLISKTIEDSGVQSVPRETLKSQAYAKVGAAVRFANLIGSVTSIKGTLATVHLGLTGTNAEGTALFSLGGEYVELLSLDASGSYGPVSYRIVLKPAHT